MDDESPFRPSINISFLNLPSAFHDSAPKFSLTLHPSSPSKFKPCTSQLDTAYLPCRTWWKTLSPVEEQKDSEEMMEGEGLLEQMGEVSGGQRVERKRKIFLAMEIMALCVLVLSLMGLIAFCLRTGGTGMLSEYMPLT